MGLEAARLSLGHHLSLINGQRPREGRQNIRRGLGQLELAEVLQLGPPARNLGLGLGPQRAVGGDAQGSGLGLKEAKPAVLPGHGVGAGQQRKVIGLAAQRSGFGHGLRSGDRPRQIARF